MIRYVYVQLFLKERFDKLLSLHRFMGYIRGSSPEVFYKKSVFRNFTKFTGKRLCQSLFFNKVAGLHRCFPVQLLHHRAFPVDFAKFSRTAFFRSNQSPADILQNITEHFQWLPLCFAKTLQTMVHCLFY